MFRRAWSVLTAAVVLLALTAGTASAYTPDPGPLFNNPRGSKTAKARIIQHIIASINATPRHGEIRIAAYSFDRPDVGDAIVAAHNRDVDVQMVLNDNWTSTQTLRLRRVLGTDPNRRSFVVICRAACRGGAGNQHMKFYLFSKSGSARDVTMLGSANLTGFGAFVQWNDMFTIVNNYAVRALYTKVFEQLVRDIRLDKPYLTTTAGGFEHWFYPHPGTTKDNDPEMRRLNRVSCKATGGAGSNGRTVIRITMYGWNQERGLYLADKVADLARRGCNVKVLLSDGGGKVYRHLKAGGVKVKSADLDLNGNPDDGFEESGYELFTHEKYMLLSGGYAGNTGTWNVWTGSENWSNIGTINDEVIIRIPRRAAYDEYLANFDYIWKNWSRWL